MKYLIVYIFFVCHDVDAFVYTKDGVELNYKISFKHFCRGKKDIIGILPGISLPDCVFECSMRNSCKTLSYKRASTMCNLYSSETREDDTSKVNCVEVRSSDITFLKVCYFKINFYFSLGTAFDFFQ